MKNYELHIGSMCYGPSRVETVTAANEKEAKQQVYLEPGEIVWQCVEV